MQDYLVGLLQCPFCGGELRWDIQEQQADRIERAESRCRECATVYPVLEGIGLFLTHNLDRSDPWQQADNTLTQYLRQHPEVEKQLMDVPMETLAPADQFFRSLVLEERGDYIGAKEVEAQARKGLYTPEYQTCLQKQIGYVLGRAADTMGPVVDLASGRGYLVEEMVQRIDAPLLATDFSPKVLRRNRRWLEASGVYRQVSLLAFDARKTPFKDQSIDVLTTNLGLPNVQEPGSLYQELRRIVAGKFLAITHFYPQGDGNAEAIRAAGMESLLYRTAVIESVQKAGFEVKVRNSCQGLARPTPKGMVFGEAGIDQFPKVETQLEWCVLEAT
jgi:uncharacterized protein YbaR (Trm112 family)